VILLDTCVVSEALKPSPNERVLAWLRTVDEDSLFLSVIALGELHQGIELLADGTRRTSLRLWFEELRLRFIERIIPLDEEVLMTWGTMCARLKRQGTPVPAMDGLMAATALRNNALLATRNVADFMPTGAQLLNPWEYRDFVAPD